MDKNYSYIIADHIRAACFMMADGIAPSGKQRGYVLRRLIRRSLSAANQLGIDISNKEYFEDLVGSIVDIYDGVYSEILESKDVIVESLYLESQKYLKAMQVGQKEWAKIFEKGLQNYLKGEEEGVFLSKKVWDLYQTHGVPVEVSEDILVKKGVVFDQECLESLIEEHQKKSQSTSAGQFKSGLGEDSEKTRRLHTATHLLHRALRNLFGDTVKQVGSAITSEKARFDFTLDRRLDESELNTIQEWIQSTIDKAVKVGSQQMSPEEAKKLGAVGLFGEKYGDIVTVYTVGDGEEVYSREFCGGPHVENTSEIGKFKIIKQKSVGQGKKRLEFNVE